MSSSFNLGWTSQRGGRTATNQDRLGWYLPRDWATWRRRGALFVVADGIGGHAGGEVASQLAVRTMLAWYYCNGTPYPAASLSRALQAADRWVYYWAWQQPELRGMGTSLTAVALWNGYWVVGHLGDSRAYLIRAGQTWLLTRDHTWGAEALATDLLTAEEACHHPWRNLLTRHVGQGNAVADVSWLTFSRGDRLVLLTDGIAHRIWHQELALATRHSPQAMARRLASLARRRGGDDDRTALVVRFD